MYDTPHPMDEPFTRTQNGLYHDAIQARLALEDGPDLGPLKDANVEHYIRRLCALVKHCGLAADDIPALNEAVKHSAEAERLNGLDAPEDYELGHRVRSSASRAFPCDPSELAWK
jgi:hypothetical protein